MTMMSTVRKFLEKCNIDAETLYDEPLAAHTSFRIGGPADAFVLPRTEEALTALLKAAQAEGVAAQVIGGGANLLVADKGVRGIVLCTALILQDLRDGPATRRRQANGARLPDSARPRRRPATRRRVDGRSRLPLSKSKRALRGFRRVRYPARRLCPG
jgi:hypothetical protein